MNPVADPAPIDQLRAELEGPVMGPYDPGYDRARMPLVGGIDRRPAAIARPVSAADAARVVALARDSGTQLAVRGGGHGIAAHCVIDDAIVLDLAEMRGFEIDPERAIAWAQTGLTAGEYTNLAGAHGLATGFGDAGSVGIGGITLGGGVGFLSRAYGITADDLLAAEIVTADGEILEVDADNHPDLFWAIRGGGGNFGVATRLKLRLHEVGTVVGGMMIMPATAELVRSFLAAAEAAPEGLSTIANVMPAPPMPFVPAEHHGRLVLMAQVCFTGEPEAGERALAPLRALANPIVDMVRPIPYPDMYEPEPEDYHPAVVIRSQFVDGVDQSAAEAMIEALETSDAAMRVVQLRVLGGAIARVPADATAYAHRDARMIANVVNFYDGPDDKPVREAWADELAAKLSGAESPAYVNFLGDEGPERVRAAYPGATWERLAAIKARYDPQNLFCNNQNIPPAS